MESGIIKAFRTFLSHTIEVEDAILASTRADWNGSRYLIELFPNGTYRLLWKNSIRNMYHSAGRILPIPVLDDDGEVDASAIVEPFFENAIDQLEDMLTALQVEETV